ncbi:MAG: hypothetical protein EPN97_07480 [Alphaproteobacteria bacterium]|nr:MAG: hypothetical protein EPN97_07480 [Alphaproteobacteria bacterium]
MRPQDIPDFIFRGAIIAVDGQEETVTDFSLQTPIVGGHPVKGALSLYLEFKSGLALEYDIRRVREIPGRLPEFIREGAHIFCKDKLPKDKEKARTIEAANGEWEVTNFHYEKDTGKFRLMLKRPWVPGKGILSRHFNPRTMTPLPPGAETPSVVTPVYELENDISVRKPLVLKLNRK